MKRLCLAAAMIAGTVSSSPLIAGVVTFEDLGLAADSYWNGPDPNGTSVTTIQFDIEVVITTGQFTSGDVSFLNVHNETWGVWSKFAYSNQTDIETAGYGNQYSAYAQPDPLSVGPPNTYGVGFGSRDLTPNLNNPVQFNPLDASHLLGLPNFTLPDGASILSAAFTNTTYTALSMMYGDGYAKKFGGESGDDQDWFKLTAYGIDAMGNALANSIDFYLADFRFDDNSLDYILDEWTTVDLSALSGAKTLAFNVTSSDSGGPLGDYGMNTPGYFAIDNIQFSTPAAIPEPGSLAMLGLGLSGLALGRRRIKKQTVTPEQAS